MNRMIPALLWMLQALGTQAQNYQALHGSPYIGSLSNDVNPASILNSPYSWDLTLFGIQSKTETNGFNITNANLIHQPDTLIVKNHEGNFGRYFLSAQDLHLFNTHISLNRNQAFGFGVNFRNYAQVATSTFNFSDTTRTVQDFFNINQGNIPLGLTAVQESWLEFYGTFAQVFYEDDQERIQGGITLKYLRSLGGAYVYADGGSYSYNGTNYQVTGAEAQYGYSKNYDYINGAGALATIHQSILNGGNGVSFDIGGEYVQKSGEDIGKQAKSGTDEYDWKLSAALLDVGVNHFLYGAQSAIFSGIKGNFPDSSFSHAFSKVSGLAELNDTIRAHVSQFGYLVGAFNEATPARLLINYDYRMNGYWAVNGELNVDFFGIRPNKATVREINLLTVTPRWEKSALGFFMPVQVTQEGHFWIGAAAKLGPVLIGLHNLGWILSKKDLPNGGGYLAIIIHPSDFEKDGVKCPKIF